MYKVFLVDDEIIVREGIRNNIRWEETNFILAGEAPDGEIALSMIQDIKPDILITDIRMPFMDGLALSRIVKKALPWIKIIILSGHDEFEYAREAISIGIEEYLLKPVSVQEMLATLERTARRLNNEKEELLSFTELKTKIRSAQERIHHDEKKEFDPAALLNIDGDILFTKLKYASKKDIDLIISDYTALFGDNWSENPILVYFLFGEIIVSVSKIIEALGGEVREIIPFSLDRENIQDIISSPAEFSKMVVLLLSAMIEFRDSHTKGRYQSVVFKAREYIDSNFKADISLFSTAAYVGISPNHLSTVFVQETGENFIEYLTRVRIERAKHLLKTTAMKSADITAEIGLHDPQYFSSIFKKHTGCTPREYRQRET